MSDLIDWKNKNNRLPLILLGARQVGKTWLLKEFGNQCFKNVVYVNFERAEELRSYFDGEINPTRLISILEVFSKIKITPENTLIIFDEIQEQPRALTSLKYFAEEAQEYFICAAGSLLGIALHEGTSFPVGKVDFLRLEPLTFKEFLWANNEELLVEYLENDSDATPFQTKLFDLFKQYIVVGGMPGVVNVWLNDKDFNQVDIAQDRLINSYEQDFSKHTPKQLAAKIRAVWQSIPKQLSKENRKFIYGVIRDGARAREYEDALMWLGDAGMTRISYLVEKPGIPLNNYINRSAFKIFLLDVGLLRRMSGISPRSVIIGNRLLEEFKGVLAEQFVIQELSSQKNIKASYYWTSKSNAEIDFLITDGYDVFPLECKSGTNVHSQSLKVYRSRYSPRKAVRTSLLPFKEDDSLVNIPLYLIWRLENIILR